MSRGCLGTEEESVGGADAVVGLALAQALVLALLPILSSIQSTIQPSIQALTL